jgi:ArsR family transcriptional regulator
MISPLAFYKCLSDDTRLKSLLLITLKNELCVCDLIQALALSQPKISRHLAELRKCGLLQDERRAKWVYYSLHPDLPEWALHVLTTTAHSQQSYITVELSKLTNTGNPCC